MDTNHLISIKEIIQKSALAAPPNPWKKIGSFAVGSLRSIGFDKKSELLLVISSSGRGVINCQTAEKVARDYEENFDDEIFLETEGIGPLAGDVIRVAGIYGGGLPRFTRDGWSIENVTLDWAIQDVLLLAPAVFSLEKNTGSRSVFISCSETSNQLQPVFPTQERR